MSLVTIDSCLPVDVYLSFEEEMREVDEGDIFTRVCLILSNVTESTQVDIWAVVMFEENSADGMHVCCVYD
jgi:hypothetical protein